MGKGTSNCTSINVLKDRRGTRSPTTRDLRLEITNLQQRLKLSEEAMSRHATMLREGDHRIKNSLQLVASLMSLQAKRETSTAVRDALLGAASRVNSVASIHDALQKNGGESLVDLGLTLQVMCASLQEMAGDAGHIEIGIDVESLRIPVSLAQPLVLAVNELVVNALRHAFPGRDSGWVHISMFQAQGWLHITVTDNGVGLPAEFTRRQGYGMKLVGMMMKQTGAELRTETKGGTHFAICAPIANTCR